MHSSSPLFTLYLYYEDSAALAKGWESLAKKICCFLQDGCQSNLIRLESLCEEKMKRWCRPSQWASKNPKERSHRLFFLRTIANNLMEEESFIFFHFDADCRFSDFTELSICWMHFLEFRKEIKSIMVDHYKQKYGDEDLESSEKAEQSLSKLIPLISCYSLESWLYQNTRVAIEILTQNGVDISRFLEFEKNREVLDEIEKIKDDASLYLSDRYNTRLMAEGFPFDEVYLIEKSFYQSIERARNSVLFMKVLEKCALFYQPSDEIEATS